MKLGDQRAHIGAFDDLVLRRARPRSSRNAKARTQNLAYADRRSWFSMSCVAYVYREHEMCHRRARHFAGLRLTCRLARGQHRRLPFVRRKLPDFRHITDGGVAAGAPESSAVAHCQ